jgi:L-lysine exporter family protein LysE/ArgO
MILKYIPYYLPFLKGFCTSAGLIMAIGAQNAFVLKHGIMKSHVFLIAVSCSIIDTGLIFLGVGGIGQLIVSIPHLLHITKYGGAIFCFAYGARSFYSALKSQNAMKPEATDANGKNDLRMIIVTLLIVSFLNPHVYLDTIILIGSIGAQWGAAAERTAFAVGASFASFVWFFALAYGAGYLGPLFSRPLTWRLLDAFVGLIMWCIAFSLIISS